MILINLLPPELRKARRSGVNPVIVAAAGGAVIILATAGMWGWLRYSRLPAAESALAAAQAELQAAQAQADAVKKIEDEIKTAETMYTTVTGLFTQRVTWAKLVDDFANLLGQVGEANKWSVDGYEVRCTSLSVAKAAAQAAARGAAKGAPAGVTCSFRANFRIVGADRERAGDYLRSFFHSVEKSPFWIQGGFIGKPEDPFKGDTPNWKPEINRVVTDQSMEWKRVKLLPDPKGGKK
jgi:Tfp pilus assembly protein PilN